MIRTRLLLTVPILCATLPISAQRGSRDDPSPVIRSLVIAMYSNDVAAYNKLTMPHPLRSRLTSGGWLEGGRQGTGSQSPSRLVWTDRTAVRSQADWKRLEN
jgi:hypothetical protein